MCWGNCLLECVEDLLIRFLRQKNELSVSEKLFAVRPFSGYETEPKTLKFGAKSSLEIFFENN